MGHIMTLYETLVINSGSAFYKAVGTATGYYRASDSSRVCIIFGTFSGGGITPGEMGDRTTTRGVHGNENRKIDCLRAVCDIKSIHESHCTLRLR